VPATPFSDYVFDFDGTLVQSRAAKRRAFFDIFDPLHAPAIEAVLSADPDGSRHAVIPAMIDEVAKRGLPPMDKDAAALADRYAEVAAARVAAAPEMPGASTLLSALAARSRVYIASTTPHEELLRHVSARGWSQIVTAAFGYPHRKAAVVANCLARDGLAPRALLVVGDGVSDAEAAAQNGCPFHRIATPTDLAAVADLDMNVHV
jgi:phosphoglycolate phosphatase-like HAD superfamily hydrolase